MTTTAKDNAKDCLLRDIISVAEYIYIIYALPNEKERFEYLNNLKK